MHCTGWGLEHLPCSHLTGISDYVYALCHGQIHVLYTTIQQPTYVYLRHLSYSSLFIFLNRRRLQNSMYQALNQSFRNTRVFKTLYNFLSSVKTRENVEKAEQEGQSPFTLIRSFLHSMKVNEDYGCVISLSIRAMQVQNITKVGK